MKIKFNSGDELPVNITIETPNIIIFVRAVFHENNKYYPQVFLGEYLYKLLKKMCQPYACSRCLDLLKTFMNLSHIAILKIGNVTYYCIFPGTSKSETIKLFQNINLTEKSGTL